MAARSLGDLGHNGKLWVVKHSDSKRWDGWDSNPSCLRSSARIFDYPMTFMYVYGDDSTSLHPSASYYTSSYKIVELED